MIQKWKIKIARSMADNMPLNQKALFMKSSWDEVQKIVNAIPMGKKKEQKNRK